MEAILCQGLTKRYGEITALDNLDLVVEEHSVFGFLGPNGAGKTTTVKLLTGLSTPTAGKVWITGKEVTSGNPELRAGIGFLPDVPAFCDWMTGREFLDFVGELHHLPSREIALRRDEQLELVDLKDAARRKVGGYSRGMKQRLGIAQALMNHPRVLFMDEPTSALDPVGRRDVLRLIERLSEQTTIFMSSHILSDIERVCDVVGIIDKGKLVTRSTIEDLRQRYTRSVFEMEFEEDAAPMMNILEPVNWLVSQEMVEVNDVLVLCVQVNNITRAKQELPGLVAASGLTLLRYELTLPSLEDIFVELVGGGS
ncbi:MAG TPA: ABC transporter ATP-binding protein [Dehalococcoidia bacterium]|nr:ABC transporter ATP-binding protein [Dehalococcoidia bacterium]